MFEHCGTSSLSDARADRYCGYGRNSADRTSVACLQNLKKRITPPAGGPGRESEVCADADGECPRVDVHIHDIDAIDGGRGRDIHVPDRRIKEPVFVDVHVDAGIDGDAP